MKVYFIPGLAADSRVFRHIRLPDGFESVYLVWIKPKKDESLCEYAFRLSGQISTADPFILIGLSFGGMLAVEIAKIFNPLQVILIASVPHHHHIPPWYRTAYRAGLNRILGPNLLKNAVYMKRYFTSESSVDKAIVRQMARDMDPDFIRWAVKAVMSWHTDDREINIHHIHGTRDFILPIRFTKPHYKIPGAGHLMIFNRAEEINRILFSILQ
jgi:pimeloyl-ACP methyl ester carboxylesterase